MVLAFSYNRFSTPEQKLGHSKTRQDNKFKEICHKHNLTPAQQYFFDEGKSAYRGNKQRDLARFVQLVISKEIPAHSWLVIENLDRLSRKGFRQTYKLLEQLLEHGITVATANPERVLNESKLDDILSIVEIAVIAGRAKEESDLKSERIKQEYQHRLANAEHKPLSARGPLWLKLENGEWKPIKERVEIIKKIFKLAIDKGLGQRAISKRLNSMGIKSWTGKSFGWAYVRLLLNDKRVIGTLTTKTKTIENYYPVVIDENLYLKARALTTKRKKFRGRTTLKCANLFTGIAYCPKENCTMVYVKKRKTQPARLIPSKYEVSKVRGAVSFNYDYFEREFLQIVNDLTLKDIGNGEKVQSKQVSKIEKELDKIDNHIAEAQKALARIGENPSAAIEVITDLTNRRKSLAEELEQIRSEEQLLKPTEALAQSRTILEALSSAKGEELLDLRLRLRQSIRSLISRIDCELVRNGWNTEIFCRVHFHSGHQRHIYMETRREQLLNVLADTEKWKEKEGQMMLWRDGKPVPMLKNEDLVGLADKKR